MPSIRVEAVVVNPKLHAMGGLPRKATPGAAAVDVVACFPAVGTEAYDRRYGTPAGSRDIPSLAEDGKTLRISMAPGRVAIVPLGFRMHVADPEYAAILMPRSGLGTRGLVCANTLGLFDSDFQGECVCALLHRSTDETFEILDGMRIAQMFFVPVTTGAFVEVDRFTVDTSRGGGGFGSTGTYVGTVK